ncbi:MAG: hypothetical protein ACE366_05130 [Bradymonadia bacterium]
MPYAPTRFLRSTLRLLLCAGLGSTVLVAGGHTAHGAVVLRYDLQGLVADADLIVTGKVMRSEPRWVGGRIITRHTIACDAVIKGVEVNEVVVEIPGGVIDGIGQKVAGVSQLVEAEQVVMFLAAGKVEPQVHTVVGLSQGKLRVEPTLDGPMVVRDLTGLTTVQRQAGGALQEVPPVLAQRQSLQSFVKELVQIVDAQRVQQPEVSTP